MTSKNKNSFPTVYFDYRNQLNKSKYGTQPRPHKAALIKKSTLNHTSIFHAELNIKRSYKTSQTKDLFSNDSQLKYDSVEQKNEISSLFDENYPSEMNSEHESPNRNDDLVKEHSQKITTKNNRIDQDCALSTKAKSIGPQTHPYDEFGISDPVFTSPFQLSFIKMQQIKEEFVVNNIELTQEVNDIVDLIKGQRVQMKIILEEMKREIKDKTLRKVCKDAQINTEEMLTDYEEEYSMNQGLEYEKNGGKNQEADNLEETNQNVRKSSFLMMSQDIEYQMSSESKEAYEKLIKMLQQINIDPYKILPQLPSETDTPEQPNTTNSKCYKQLSNKEVLKLQEVFISKLAKRLKEKSVLASNSEKV